MRIAPAWLEPDPVLGADREEPDMIAGVKAVPLLQDGRRTPCRCYVAHTGERSHLCTVHSRASRAPLISQQNPTRPLSTTRSTPV